MKLHVLVAVLAFVACDKGSGTNTKASAPTASEAKLTPDETAMLASLPSGNVGLFGGNLLRFQKYLSDSPVSRLMGAMTQGTGTSMTEWMSCFVEVKNVKMLGGVKLDAGHVDMAFVMSGMQLSQLEACAKRAGFPTTLDADQKFLGVEFPNLQGPVKGGYLVVAGGMLYSRVTMDFPVTRSVMIDRAMLEGDVASIAKLGSAATDKALVAQIGSVDRTKAVWFVASAAGTPVGDKIGTAHGTFEIADGVALDVTVQVLDQELANKVADGIAKAKKQADALGEPMKSVLEKLQFIHDGDQLRVLASITNAQLNALVDQVSPFLPKAGGVR